jgi:GT2 family glycosyltransferase
VPPPSISVVILCYKSEAYITYCLDALREQTRPADEVIVVENASGDRAAELARAHRIAPRVIVTSANLGCAGGNNVGWRAARGEIIVFLNPDCAAEPDFLREITRPLVEDASVGLTGAKLYFPNSRRIQHAGGILHPNAMTEHRGMGCVDDGRFDEIAPVAYVTGAAFAMRRATLETLGGLDEEYFPAYYEETDLCARVWRLGLKVLYIPRAVGYHKESSGVGGPDAPSTRMAYRSRVIYLIKNKTLWQWVSEVLPFEWHWFRQPYARGFRRKAFRAYASGAAFVVRCLLRGRRRQRIHCGMWLEEIHSEKAPSRRDLSS